MFRPLAVVTTTTLASIALVFAACGGGQSQKTEKLTGDDLDETTTKPVDSMGGDGDGDGDGTASGNNGDGDGSSMTPPPDPDAGPPPATGPAVTINIKNTFTKPLEFNLTKGWGSRILMFSGKPPNAVSIMPFAKACTASCSEKTCPKCKDPKSLGQIRKHQEANTKTVAPGDELKVEWDGQVHDHKKTRASGRSCECYDKAAAPAGTYTVRICGLRLSKKHRKHSKLECVDLEDALTLPSDGPQVLDFDFAGPTKKKP